MIVSGHGQPDGYPKPDGHGFGQIFIPVMSMGFLTGTIFLRGYEFGQEIPNGFLPVAISIKHAARLELSTGMDELSDEHEETGSSRAAGVGICPWS